MILDFGLNHARSGFKPKKFYRQRSVNVVLYGIIELSWSWRAAMPLHVSIVSVKNYKYIRVYSSYRNEKGQPRSRLIENHGRLDTALSKDPQYVE